MSLVINNASSLFKNLVDEDGVVRLIFEGMDGSPFQLYENASECYVEVIMKYNDEIIASDKLYMHLMDIKNYYDHFTVGKGYYEPFGDQTSPVCSTTIIITGQRQL